jgi:multiple sugar transport system substrate-binding protein
MSFCKPTRRDVLRGTAATGAGLLMAGKGLPALAQDQPLPEGAAGKLTVIHRTEYFPEAQTLFRDQVGAFAEATSRQPIRRLSATSSAK